MVSWPHALGHNIIAVEAWKGRGSSPHGRQEAERKNKK
jgi:hypothetical protein